MFSFQKTSGFQFRAISYGKRSQITVLQNDQISLKKSFYKRRIHEERSEPYDPSWQKKNNQAGALLGHFLYVSIPVCGPSISVVVLVLPTVMLKHEGV